MLTLDTPLHIPARVAFSSVEQEAVLLNKQTNQYYMLDEVGARFWSLLQDGQSPRECHQALLAEYEVDPIQLEQDLLELVNDLMDHGLLEIVHA
jgi:hypothetical protein